MVGAGAHDESVEAVRLREVALQRDGEEVALGDQALADLATVGVELLRPVALFPDQHDLLAVQHVKHAVDRLQEGGEPLQRWRAVQASRSRSC